MELGHQFKLVIINSDIFVGSQFNAQQSERWLRHEMNGYPDKPFVIVTFAHELSVLSAMIALVNRFDPARITLAVSSNESVTFRGPSLTEIEGNIWAALKQHYGLLDTDVIRVTNWTGLRMSQDASLFTYIANGWLKPEQNPGFAPIAQILTDRDSHNPH